MRKRRTCRHNKRPSLCATCKSVKRKLSFVKRIHRSKTKNGYGICGRKHKTLPAATKCRSCHDAYFKKRTWEKKKKAKKRLKKKLPKNKKLRIKSARRQPKDKKCGAKTLKGGLCKNPRQKGSTRCHIASHQIKKRRKRRR